MGFEVVNKFPNIEVKKLIDLCLKTINYNHACDYLNLLIVFYHTTKHEPEYRKEEINYFLIKMLKKFYKHYIPKYGGFSFLEGKANMYYYGVKYSRGLNEPDTHGSQLFIWGIALISHILDWENDCKFILP